MLQDCFSLVDFVSVLPDAIKDVEAGCAGATDLLIEQHANPCCDMFRRCSPTAHRLCQVAPFLAMAYDGPGASDLTHRVGRPLSGERSEVSSDCRIGPVDALASYF
ncbi:hypothetical protein SDC9_203518 [bioreactor metagenome]|uniref:Uncharacterized protein n=1 Tax=bioreactor metagenome TaxID=1076179 RepID=A0A645J5T6_9ZZZZ